MWTTTQTTSTSSADEAQSENRAEPRRQPVSSLRQPPERAYRWIVFDADGTLFDFQAAERLALRQTLGFFHIDLTPEVHAAYRNISDALWAAFERGELSSQTLRVRRFEMLRDEFAFEPDPTEVSERYIHDLGGHNPLLPGAKQVIRNLAGRFELIIATNGIAEIQRQRFGRSEIRPYFRDVVISDEIGVAKPDPAYFDVVFERMGRPKRSEVLMVGDGLSSDIAGGEGYGLDTCWVNAAGILDGSDPQPNYVIRNLTELLTEVL